MLVPKCCITCCIISKETKETLKEWVREFVTTYQCDKKTITRLSEKMKLTQVYKQMVTSSHTEKKRKRFE